jgi:hypothetical protein
MSNTKMFLHNLSERHVSALSWAIFRLNTFLCEANNTINNVVLLLSTRSRVTSIKSIHWKLIAGTVGLKRYYNTKDTKEQDITITEGTWSYTTQRGCLTRKLSFRTPDDSFHIRAKNIPNTRHPLYHHKIPPSLFSKQQITTLFFSPAS